VSTRLVWVILFAVAVGLVAFFSLRSVQSGAASNQLVATLAAAQQVLAQRHPDSRFHVRFARPAPKVSNLVVTIEPAHADSAAVTALVESVEQVVRNRPELTRFDSLVVVVAGRVVRSGALR
jgi:hypothetical protein